MEKFIFETANGESITLSDYDPQKRYSYSPWRRLLARSFDILIFGIFFGLCLRFTGGVSEKFAENWVAQALTVGFLWVIVEPILILAIGTTPGKWLFRIKLISTINGLSATVLFTRAFKVWFNGCGIYFPIVSLFTYSNAHKRVSNQKLTSWDEECGTDIVPIPSSKFRIIVAYVFSVAFFLICSVISKEPIHQQNKLATSGNSSLSTPKNVDLTFTENWKVQDLGEIEIESPVTLTEDLNMRLSQEVMENLDGIRFFRGKFDSGSSDQIFHIAISEMHLKKDTTLSVENTLNGSMEDTIKETGTVSRNYTASDTEISGLPAKQAVYVNKLDGLPFYIHGLVVRSTQRAWKIMIITTIRSAPAISKRVIESLKIRIKKEYSKL